MNYKKYVVIVSMLLILPIVLSAAGLANENPYATPKMPGCMETPFPNLPGPAQKIIRDHEIPQPISSQDPTVITMMDVLTEPLFLGYLEDLVDFGPRVTNTQACWDSGDWIYDEFKAMGLTVRYQNWTSSSYQGSNIEATLPGIDPSSDEIFIVCAHYDSVPGSPGADDDGSGVIAAMTLAYIMRDYTFNHTIRFVAFSGEEQGLHGSHEYAEEASNNGDNIIGVLNADMIAYALTQSHGNQIKIYNNDESGWLYDFTESISQEYYEHIQLTTLDSGYSYGSDHYSFWQYNYDAVFYHEYKFNDYYHSPQDIIANMNLTYGVKSTKLMLATLAELAETQAASEPPQKPIVDGPATSIMGAPTNITVTTTDPEGDNIFYFVEWGDSTTTNWVGPYASGETVTLTHTWYANGTYEYQVRARDTYNVMSNWSDPQQIIIQKGPLLNIKAIQSGFLKATTTLENLGEVEATDITYNIAVSGGALLLKGSTSGTITNIPGESSTEISTAPILGFGKITILITTSLPNGQTDQHQQSGTALLFFVLMNPGGG